MGGASSSPGISRVYTDGTTITGKGTSSSPLVAIGGGGGGGGGGGTVTPSIAISQSVTSGMPNLTTLGTSDWLANQQNSVSGPHAVQWARKLTGARQLEVPQWVGNPANIANVARSQAVTWTAIDNLSQASAGAGFATPDLAYDPSALGFGFVTSAPSSTISRRLAIYVANYNETVGVTCTASFVDNEVSPQAVTFTMAGIDNRTVIIDFVSAQATRLNVSCLVSSNPAGVNLGWLAMWLA